MERPALSALLLGAGSCAGSRARSRSPTSSRRLTEEVALRGPLEACSTGLRLGRGERPSRLPGLG
eukprot:7662668-Lingulodinium_polyedra.AAC.1